MISRRLNIYVPGILTIPGDSRNWSGRAVTYTHRYSDIRAEKVEYLAGPGFTRSIFQRRRAGKLIRTLEYCDRAERIRLVGHSNGCDVILDALRERNAEIEQLHLVCAACEADAEKNMLNDLLLSEQVCRLFVYIAGRDRALRFARGIGRIFGYGTLGITGPLNLSPLISPDRVTIINDLPWSEFGHSDCWSDDHFAATMEHFLAP